MIIHPRHHVQINSFLVRLNDNYEYSGELTSRKRIPTAPRESHKLSPNPKARSEGSREDLSEENTPFERMVNFKR